jgi:cobalt-zinc-cadmium efflux system outer membrane protein
VYDVHAAFVALAAAVARVAIQRETATRLEQADRIVRARVDAGAAPHYDASRMGVALADARASVANAEADVIAARGTLNMAVGPLAAMLHGVPDLDLFAAPNLPALAALLETTRAQRPDLAAARGRALAAYSQIDVARRGVVQGATIYLGAGFGAGTDPTQGNPTQTDLVLGVTVPLPVFDHGQGAVPAAMSRAVAASNVVRALELVAEQRVTAAYNEVLRRREALAQYRGTGVAESVGMRREAEAGYREGRLSILELVDAYISLRDAQLRLVSLAADTRTAEVNLRRAVGAP